MLNLMKWLQTALRRGKEDEPAVIVETTPPSEQECRLISEVIRKLTDQSAKWRWRPVYDWDKAFEAVKTRRYQGLTDEEKSWMLGEFEPEMERCEKESQGAEGYFRHPTALGYPEGYFAVRAGGFEVPILAPAEFKWGGRMRGTRVPVADQLLGFFEEKPVISPDNEDLFGYMRTMLGENMRFINKVFGFIYSELDLMVVKEGKFGLRLGRKKPGVLFNVLRETVPVAV